MELRHLRYFCAVAEEQNLTRAAEKLFIAQPPLTRQIKQLEEDIGAQLFIRSTRGLSLTPAGEYFWGQAKQILEKADVSIKNTRHIAEKGQAVFNIGFVPSVFYGQLPSLVRSLRERTNADIMLHDLTTGEQIEALKSGKIDIGFGRLLIPDEQVEQKTLFQEPLLAALPSNHPNSIKEPTLEELANIPMILYPAGKAATPTFADICASLFTSRGLTLKIIQQVNDLQTALGLVASEMGFTLVSEQVNRLKRDDVVFLPLKDKTITSPVIFSRRKEPMNDMTKVTIEILKEIIKRRSISLD